MFSCPLGLFFTRINPQTSSSKADTQLRYTDISFTAFFTSLFVSSDHQETATTGQSDKFSSVRETAKQIEAAREEEEEDDDDEGGKIKETTEENSRGSNWDRERKRAGKNWGEWRCFVRGLKSAELRRDEGLLFGGGWMHKVRMGAVSRLSETCERAKISALLHL